MSESPIAWSRLPCKDVVIVIPVVLAIAADSTRAAL